ncbi:hypothetical protein H6G80_09350 [Nostoc sp. FACHB-87]|uniref:hypothetical protein n=1 Tax=Nostocales TaxID=1161 RepID=UPI001688898F|nr:MULTISPECIES: hypothetical protein [Nostocales]MBD2298320.1 hypothetical protein [Nostoc sp. FACHB-190]MBD2454283.1 hypothetical protein [Nostoc sp. FACHB-87]MBD2474124.1 hypothetical protein [Anabaena sp. FACHB-83]MBD2488726.1 hypothetical protein [Aulosira sp. FACHB-615]
MKFAPSLLTGVAVAGLLTVANVTLPSVNPSQTQAIAAEGKDALGLTPQQEIDLITKHKGTPGSGDQLRRFFFGDLEPIGIQPGGAGQVVNLYNKANNVTFSYCSTFDVVVAVKKGKVPKFPANEVK